MANPVAHEKPIIQRGLAKISFQNLVDEKTVLILSGFQQTRVCHNLS